MMSAPRAARRGRCLVLAMVLAILVYRPGFAGDLDLVEAIKNRDMEAARSLLKQKIDVNLAQPDGATALHWAAHWDDVAIADLLIRAGAQPNAANDYGVRPLTLACSNGSLMMIERLLKAGADPNAPLPSGETPMMTAARTGRVEVVDVLFAAGADPNAKERSRGQTALMWALSEQHWDVARALVRHGADVRARSEGGFTALLFTARHGDVDTARLLLDTGANVNDASTTGVTSLLLAVVRGHVGLATFLLDRGADPNADGPGYTALHWTAGSWETEITGEFGITADASEWRAMAGLKGEAKIELVKALLGHGANPNARTTRNVTQFGFSASSNTPQFYVTTGATPFLLAAQAGDAAVMRVLAARGGNPRLATNSNSTAVMQAAGISRVIGESRVTETNALEAVALALELGGDVNAVDEYGDTALHAAASQGMNDVVQFLIDRGARLDAKNTFGETPWTIASGRGIRRGGVNISHERTAVLLEKLGATTQPENRP